MSTQKIIPNIWSNNRADEAARFYCTVFGGAITHTSYYDEVTEKVVGKPADSVMLHELELLGSKVVIINGGAEFAPTPAISLMVNCRDAAEFDQLWGRLSVSGKVLMPPDAYPFSPRYGWCEDQFGVSWQVITALNMPEQELVPVFMCANAVWGQAEAIMQFYVATFQQAGIEAKVGEVARISDLMPDGTPSEVPKDAIGKVMFANFFLAGQRFSIMDSVLPEQEFGFTPGISFLIDGKDQAEMDYFYDTLSAVPEAEVCGWLQDKYGVSWQVSNVALERMLQSGDKAAIGRANAVMLQMKRLNIAELERAFRGE